jgi:hypothetical protein
MCPQVAIPPPEGKLLWWTAEAPHGRREPFPGYNLASCHPGVQARKSGSFGFFLLAKKRHKLSEAIAFEYVPQELLWVRFVIFMIPSRSTERRLPAKWSRLIAELRRA